MLTVILGADERQKYLATYLRKNMDVSYFEGGSPLNLIYDNLKKADIIILPIPMTRDDIYINSTKILLNDFFKIANKDAIVYAGACDKYKEMHRKIIDYNLNEEFTFYNAMLTAEATVAIAIENTQTTLNNTEILVLGNGRIGKHLARYFKPFGANVTISARKEKDFIYIKNQGNSYINSENITDLKKYNIIINTIPANIISCEAIRTISEGTLIIDLASKNSGLNVYINYIDAKSLPGKYSPKSSAEMLYKTILESIKEEKI